MNTAKKASLVAVVILAASWWLLETASVAGRPSPLASPERLGAEAPAHLEGVPEHEVDAETRRAQAEQPTATLDALDAPPSASFHGRVICEATRDPVHGAGVRLGETEVITDVEGAFDLGLPLRDDVEAVRVMNPCQGTHIRDSRRESWEPDGDGGWVLPIVVGPTYRLRISTPGVLPGARWRARMVEVSAEGQEHPWGWTNLCPGDPRWFRYDNPQPPTYPGPGLRLEVISGDGLIKGSTKIVYAVSGLHPQVPTVVAVEALGLLQGRVVDPGGAPLSGIEVFAPRLGGAVQSSPLRTRTDDRGRFEFSGLKPCDLALRFRDPRGAEARLERVPVPPGETTLDDVVLAPTPRVGSIVGRLVGEGPIRARLFLRALEGPAFTAIDTVNTRRRPGMRGAGGGSPEFQFNDLPAGDYELQVLPLDGRAWSPASMRVSPPAEGLVFTRLEETVETWFRVEDGQTGRELEEFQLQLHFGHLFSPGTRRHRSDQPLSLAANQPLTWAVSAPGFVPSYGDENDFHQESGDRVARVRLSPGWGATLLLRDRGGLLYGDGNPAWRDHLAPWERPPVPGVTVLLDGVEVGTSDSEGMVRLAGERAPHRIELVDPDWTVFESEGFREGRLTEGAPEVVVWLVRG